MKQLTCEVCGSNELMKQDGIFVCQVCGCKYSLEDVKKMMVEGVVEVTGTVKVDNSSAINNYLNMAKNARDAGNNKEAEDYCNKIIELDVTNSEAWYMKGCAVGWQSTLAKSRIPESINAFTNAIENCPEEGKEKLKTDCKDQLDSINNAILSLRAKAFKSNPNQNDVNGLRGNFYQINSSTAFCKKFEIPMTGLECLTFGRTVNTGLCDAWDVTQDKFYKNNEGHPVKFAWDTFHTEGDALIAGFDQILAFLGTTYDRSEINGLIIQIYKNKIVLQEALIKSCSYKITFNNGYKQYVEDWSFTEKAKGIRRDQIKEWNNKISEVQTTGERKVIEAAQKRKEDYWDAHKEEKEALEKEKQTLEQERNGLKTQKDALDKEREEVPTSKAVKDIQTRIDALSKEKNGLGLFKSKEKKELQAQIEALEAQMSKHKASMEAEQAEVDKRIAPVASRMSEIDKRLSVIRNEFEKDR